MNDLFTGPWLKYPGELPKRLVLHARYEADVPAEYVVHVQYRKEEDGQFGYTDGNYYPVHYENAFSKAMNKFWERCGVMYGGSETSIFLMDYEA